MPDRAHLVGILGGAVLAIGFVLGLVRQVIAIRRTATTGTVVEMLRDDSEGTYSPVVEFRTPDGTAHRFKHGWASYPPAYQVSQQVKVRYSPSRPSHAAIDLGVLGIWAGPLVCVVIGAVVAFLGSAG